MPYLDISFACFGHSLGALLAFELCCWLRHNADLTPEHIWVSAAPAPHLSLKRVPLHKLPDKDFIHMLKSYGGTPTSVLDNAELMAMTLPILRADFALLETYQYQSTKPFSCSITAFWGSQDATVDKEEVADWQVHTQDFSLKEVDGEHFFIRQLAFPKRLLPQITVTL